MQISRLAAEDEGAADFGGPLIFAACCAPREGPLGVSPMPDQRRGFFTPRNRRVGPESNVRFGSIADIFVRSALPAKADIQERGNCPPPKARLRMSAGKQRLLRLCIPLLH